MPRVAGAVSVSCITATSCYAAVSSGSGPQIAHWNGKAWSTAKVPNPAVKPGFAVLYDISCTNASSCVAVGNVHDSPAPGFGNRTFALVWNGRTWSLVKTPRPAGTAGIEVESVACSSATSCVAVGNYGTTSRSSLNRSFALRRNGKTWSLTAAPRIPAGAATTHLSGVSCATSIRCLAVGQWVSKYADAFGGLVERWNGLTWSALTAADIGSFGGASCTSTTNCVLIGGSNTVPEHAAVEQWDGSLLSAMTIPLPNDTSPAGGTDGLSELSGIACRSTSMCVAVGSDLLSQSQGASLDPPTNTLIEQLG